MAIDTSLYGRLQRLFGTSVIIRNVGGNQLKAIDLDNVQSLGNKQSNGLMDKYGRIHSVHYASLYDYPSNYSTLKPQLYRDYETMDTDAIISSALDVLADECLGGKTIIPLLNGDKKSIEDLHKEGATNFWLYGLNKSTMSFEPIMAEKVAHNGKKQVYAIIFDDGTIVEATSNHIWISSDGSELTTSELVEGSSILALPTKLSDNKTMKGYEKIWNGKSFDYVHRIVGNNVPFLKEQKEKIVSNRTKVLHHASFDKLNNDPNFLQWMDWSEHNKVHSDFNKNLWSEINSDYERKEKIRKTLVSGSKRYWDSVDREEISNRRKETFSKMTSEEKKNKFGKSGSSNNMFGKGYKLSGEKNGRYNKESNRIENINLNNIILEIASNPKNTILEELRLKYNFSKFAWRDVKDELYNKYNCANHKVLVNKILVESRPDIVSDFRKYCSENYKGGNRLIVKDFCEKKNISLSHLRRVIINSGYSTLEEFANSKNHRVLRIEKRDIVDVYDIVNAGTNHIYAIEANDGSKLYTHNCTLKNENREILQIRSSDDKIQSILYNLFYDILNVEYTLWPWIRNMCKYGDHYVYLRIKEGYGIYNVLPMPPHDINRHEGENPEKPDEVFFTLGPDGQGSGVQYNKDLKNRYENFEIAHFRLLSDTRYLPYGRAYIEPARKIYKQLSLMEEAMMIHRIMRAPEKRVFYINIGAIPPNEVEQFMKKTVDKMKKTPFVDPQTGEYNLKYNMMNALEDFYIPVRGGDATTRIDTAKGLEYNAIEDVNYLRDKLLASLKIPKAFFGYEKDLSGKSTLAAEDIRFGRTIQRLQSIVVSELTRIALIHLYVQGYTDERLTNFELGLTTPSIIYEQEKIALWKEKVSLAQDLVASNLVSSDWIYDKIFEFSEDQVSEMRDLIAEDKKRIFRLTQIENEGNDPSESGESYGTPHDLASLYGRDRLKDAGLPDGYDETKVVGRPKEKSSIYGTQDSAFGRDAIGKKEMNAPMDSNPLKHNFKGGSPLSLKERKEINIFLGKGEKENEKDLLSESNIKDL